MATLENEYFLRITCLLLKGGTFILKKVLLREVKKNGDDLDVSLGKFKGKLRHELHKKQFEKVFAFGGTDVEKWDIAIFINVLIIVFRQTLTDNERRAIRSMLHIRNETYAHIPNAWLSQEKYEDSREELQDAINELASPFDQVVKAECASVLKECLHDPLDRKSQVEHLKQFNDDLSRLVIAKISSTEKQLKDELESTEKRLNHEITLAKEEIIQQTSEIHDKVIEAIRKALSERRTMKTVKVVETELTLKGDEEKWIELAEQMIVRVTDEAIRRTGGSTEFELIEQAVKLLLNEINNNDDTEVIGVRQGSILLRIRCTSYIALLDLLLYLDSSNLQQRLKAVASAVTETFSLNHPVKLSAKIPDHVLQRIYDELETKGKERTIRLPIRCSSFWGLEHVWKLFREDDATEKINKIADVISNHLGTKIFLKASIDVNQFQQFLKEEGVLNGQDDSLSSTRDATGIYKDYSWDEQWEDFDTQDLAVKQSGDYATPDTDVKKPKPLIRKKTKHRPPVEPPQISETYELEVANADLLHRLSLCCMESDVKSTEVFLLIGSNKSGKTSFIYTLQESLTGATHQFATISSLGQDNFTTSWYRHLGVNLWDVPLQLRNNWQAVKCIIPHLPHVLECRGLETLDKSRLQDVLDRKVAGYIWTAGGETNWSKLTEAFKSLFARRFTVSKIIFVQNVFDDINKDLLMCAVRALDKRTMLYSDKGDRIGSELMIVLSNCDREADLHRLGEKKRRSDEVIEDIDQYIQSIGHNPTSIEKLRWTNLNAANSYRDPHITQKSLNLIRKMISQEIGLKSVVTGYVLKFLQFVMTVSVVVFIIGIHTTEIPRKFVVLVDMVLIIGFTVWLSKAYNRWKKQKRD